MDILNAVEDVQYHRGVMTNVGDILSAVGDVQYHGGYHEYLGGYQYRRGYHDTCVGDVHCRNTILISLHDSQDIPPRY